MGSTPSVSGTVLEESLIGHSFCTLVPYIYYCYNDSNKYYMEIANEDVIESVQKDTNSYIIIQNPIIFTITNVIQSWCTAGYSIEITIKLDRIPRNRCIIIGNPLVPIESNDKIVMVYYSDFSEIGFHIYKLDKNGFDLSSPCGIKQDYLEYIGWNPPS